MVKYPIHSSHETLNEEFRIRPTWVIKPNFNKGEGIYLKKIYLNLVSKVAKNKTVKRS